MGGIGMVLALALVGTNKLAHAVTASDCSITNGGVPCLFGGFEIDGNTIVDHGGVDWQSSSVYNSSSYTPFYDLYNTTSDNIMSQGSKESDQTTWTCVNSKPPGKSDLGGPNYSATTPTGDTGGDPGTAAGEFANKTINGVSTPWAGSIYFENTDPGQSDNVQYLFGNFQRFAVNGDVHIDYEFNKASQLLASGCPTLPVRSQGDVLITFDTNQGGATIFVSAFIWNCSTATAKGVPCTDGGSFALVADTGGGAFKNGTDFAGTANISSASTDNGVTQGAFGEAGLNLTSTVGNFTCGEFGTSYMKSRSAGTSDIANGKAEVKDYTSPVGFSPGSCPVSTLSKAQADEGTADSANGAEATEVGETGLTYTQDTAANPLTVKAGDEVVYQLTYKNTGGGTANNVAVTDTIPTGPPAMTFVSSSCTPSAQCYPQTAASAPANAQTFCSGTPTAASSGTITELVWCLGDQAPTGAGSGVVLTFEVTVPSSFASTSTVTFDNAGYVSDSHNTTPTESNVVVSQVTPSVTPTLGKLQYDARQSTNPCNTATIGSTSPGSVSSNQQCIYIPGTLNTLSAGDTLFTSSSISAAPGDVLEYELTYMNSGNAPEAGVVVTDPIPSGTGWSSTFNNGSCTVSAGTCIPTAQTSASSTCTSTPSTTSGVKTVIWCLGTVAAGGSATLTFEITLSSLFPAGTTTVTNTASSVDSAGNDLQESVSATVTAAGNLGLVKSASAPVTCTVSNATKTCVTYTLSYYNMGNGNLTGQEITDVLPAGEAFVSASNGGTNSGGTVTWTGLTVAAGTSPGSPAGSVTVTVSY